MRIIGGENKGKNLLTPKGKDVRPTSNKVRQSIFNILEHNINWSGFGGKKVIDLFAGTGGMGFEALSRGAESVVFIDVLATALEIIQINAKKLRISRSFITVKCDVRKRLLQPIKGFCPANIVFIDPPYGKNLMASSLNSLAHQGWLEEGAICICEMEANKNLKRTAEFSFLDRRFYGNTQVYFLKFNCRK